MVLPPVAAIPIVEAGCELGESPVYDDRERTLFWIDGTRGLIYRYVPAVGALDTIRVPYAIGCIALRCAGGLVLGMESSFWVLEPDGTLRHLAALPAAESLPINDGKCDPQGRFWAGTVAVDDTHLGSLYRLDPPNHVTPVLSDVMLSNGLGWSPSGRLFYYVDTPTARVDQFEVADAGTLSNRRPLAAIPPSIGVPDGLAVDVEGGIWVAIWGGGAVHRYLPSGELDRIVTVAASQTSSCTFGGPDLSDLYITTAREDLSESELLSQPLAGALFRCNVGIPGLPTNRFAG